jgi:hypothetical protein
MNLDPVQQRQEAHMLIDVLPDEKLYVVRSLLEVLVDPASMTMDTAPSDDEELNEDTIASIQRARGSLQGGKGIPHAEILREFGL